ncbi:hypothetical protein NUSPORA_01494 [Nucleospora cyclopteri]
MLNSHSTMKEILEICTEQFLENSEEMIVLDPKEYFFVLEEAYWHALDILQMPEITFKSFCKIILKYNGLLGFSENYNKDTIKKKLIFDVELSELDDNWVSKHIHIQSNALISNFHQEIVDFANFRKNILVFGCVCFSPDFSKFLVVKQSNNNLSFPKGKKLFNESGKDCAIRETYEEIGYDVSDKITDISVSIFGKITLFVVLNVSETVKFEPVCRNEVSKIFWCKINGITTHKKQALIKAAANELGLIIKTLKKTAFKFQNLNLFFETAEQKEIEESLKNTQIQSDQEGSALERNIKLLKTLQYCNQTMIPHEIRTRGEYCEYLNNKI